jgi:hypothetical protein
MKDVITWKELKTKYPQFAQRFQKEFEELFKSLGRLGKPYLTIEDIENVIAELGEGYEEGRYEVSLEPWKEAQRIRDEVTQIVVDINVSGGLEGLLGQYPDVYDFFRKVSETSIRSRHPGIKDKTVGWFRVDIIPDDKGREILFIDEIQSDIVQTAEGLLENRGKYAEIREKLIEEGRYTEDQIDEICEKTLEIFEDWSREGLATIIRWAQKVGIKWIGTHTRESKTQGSYIADVYDTLKKEFGFRDEVVNLEGVGSVKIGIRRASIMRGSSYADVAMRLVHIAEELLKS